MEKDYLLRKIARIMVPLPVLQQSWFHPHTENDQKIHKYDGETDNGIAFMASRSAETI